MGETGSEPSNRDAGDNSSTQHPGRDNRLDLAAMRGLAHPLRVRILDELSMFGPRTASGLAERLNESSGATSYHLRQLEKVGLVVEDTERGNARERWWQRRPGSIALPDSDDFPVGSADRLGAQMLQDEFLRGRETVFHEYVNEGDRVFGKEWQDVAASDTINLRLTPEQLHQLVLDIDVVLWKYIDAYKTTPTPGSLPTQIQINAFPLVRGASDETPDETPEKKR